MATILALILAGLKAFGAWCEWQAAKTEIETRTLLWDRQEAIDAQNEADEKEIHDLRAAGRNNDADQLRIKVTRRALFRSSLSAGLPRPVSRTIGTDEKGNLPPADRRDVGGSVAVPDSRGRELGPSGGVEETPKP